MPTPIAVLASGAGSNLQAVLDYFSFLDELAAGQVVYVASDRPDAGALERARARGIACEVLDEGARDTGLLAVLQNRRIGLVALAGYLRRIPQNVTAAYRGRIVNVHPALLPAFGGAGMFGHRVHDAVLRSGVRVTGATVHFVDDELDHGPIIAQWPVPVADGDSAESLGARVLTVEHALYPRVIEAVASGRISLGTDGRVVSQSPWPPFHYGAVDSDGVLRADIDRVMS